MKKGEEGSQTTNEKWSVVKFCKRKKEKMPSQEQTI
jgi:hypothetical protein